jgi:hypothetical protein
MAGPPPQQMGSLGPNQRPPPNPQFQGGMRQIQTPPGKHRPQDSRGPPMNSAPPKRYNPQKIICNFNIDFILIIPVNMAAPKRKRN